RCACPRYSVLLRSHFFKIPSQPLSFMLRAPILRSTLFPYTTLFRSIRIAAAAEGVLPAIRVAAAEVVAAIQVVAVAGSAGRIGDGSVARVTDAAARAGPADRSSWNRFSSGSRRIHLFAAFPPTVTGLRRFVVISHREVPQWATQGD